VREGATGRWADAGAPARRSRPGVSETQVVLIRADGSPLAGGESSDGRRHPARGERTAQRESMVREAARNRRRPGRSSSCVSAGTRPDPERQVLAATAAGGVTATSVGARGSRPAAKRVRAAHGRGRRGSAGSSRGPPTAPRCASPQCARTPAPGDRTSDVQSLASGPSPRRRARPGAADRHSASAAIMRRSLRACEPQ
jgi:hypothetical protein